MKELLENWASLYANHAALRTLIAFVHIGGLLVGGGSAVAMDLMTLSATRERTLGEHPELSLLSRTHRVVAVGLVAIFVSGFLLLGADLDTYWYSRVYWLKMGLVVLLLANGAFLLMAERQLQLGRPDGPPRLRKAAWVSLTLWFLTTLAGAALPNVG
jgi:hypothetical protein